MKAQNAKAQNVRIKNGLERFKRITYKTLRLFYGILLWLVWMFLGGSYSCKYSWLVFSLNCSYKKDDRILQLERIAHKGQPTKEECLTLQIELPEGCLFSFKRTSRIGKGNTPRYGKPPFHILYSAKLNQWKMQWTLTSPSIFSHYACDWPIRRIINICEGHLKKLKDLKLYDFVFCL